MTSKTDTPENDLKKIQDRYAPTSILAILILGIALPVVIAMAVVYSFRRLPYYQQVVIDAGVMTVIILPLLYLLSFRPILRHIEMRRQAESALLQKDELQQRYFNSIYVQIAYMDREFNFIKVNDAYARSAGYSQEYFVGKNHFALYPNVENEEVFQRVVETGNPLPWRPP